MNVLLLRFDAPLMSFGDVIVDQHNVTDRSFPRLSLLTGLLANALGYRHGDAEALEALQARIEFAARWDVAPARIVDYHTVNLGQEKMKDAAQRRGTIYPNIKGVGRTPSWAPISATAIIGPMAS